MRIVEQLTENTQSHLPGTSHKPGGEVSFDSFQKIIESGFPAAYTVGDPKQIFKIQDFDQKLVQKLEALYDEMKSKGYSEAVRTEICRSALFQLSGINISQGASSSTCHAATWINKLAMEDPERYLEVLRGLVIDGRSGELSIDKATVTQCASLKGCPLELDGIAQRIGGAPFLMQYAVTEYLNGSNYSAVIRGDNVVSVGQAEGLPPVVFGAFDSWFERGGMLFGDKNDKFVYNNKEGSFVDRVQTELDRGEKVPVSINLGASHHLLLISEIRDGRVYFQDSQFHSGMSGFSYFEKNELYEGAKREGGSQWSISVERAFGLDGREAVLRGAVIPKREGDSFAGNEDKSIKQYQEWAKTHGASEPYFVSLPLEELLRVRSKRDEPQIETPKMPDDMTPKKDKTRIFV